ncbi:hypothetical protein [Chitinophaga qingshengii]|uniref:Uncharacterized protein n=1 Tax=Chitinophaga qingshengii TaxID=1569794 RepID=A0ABR7TT46_9BACT|nr:hypothetical protein [Chitinophaga qingshengii]MBC9932830.1 hypothetical protein [Chitinophaga qingshengii]
MKIYHVLLAAGIACTACNKSAKLEPSPQKPFYTLPQGNHSYDDTIVAFHKKYDTYILYKFSQDDYAYDYTNKRADTAYEANPAYIGASIRFFYDQLLNIYPEKFVQATMPLKIFLASGIGAKGIMNPRGFTATRSMLAIGWANDALPGKTPAEIKRMRGQLHRYYIERAFRANIVAIPNAFIALTPSKSYEGITPSERLNNAIVDTEEGTMSLTKDFLGYIEMITGKTKAELDATLLSPVVDRTGLIKQKYEIVLTYFRNDFGIDLQSVGEQP